MQIIKSKWFSFISYMQHCLIIQETEYRQKFDSALDRFSLS